MIHRNDPYCILSQVAASTESLLAWKLGPRNQRPRRVSVRPLHFAQLLTGFPAFQVHGSNSSRRLIEYPPAMRESTSWR